MSGTDEFTPRLGRIGDRGAAAGKRYSSRVRKAVAKLSKGGRSGFSGARIGRGSAAARAVQFREHAFAKFRMRRVVVKVHIARGAKGIGSAAFKAHLNYIQRDGVDHMGEDGKSLGGELYNRDGEKLDDKDFLARSEDDRHQFRIIVSPEDGDALGDLKENTRRFMSRMETDLGTKLDWVAVDHYNTGHPHTHIVIRGKDERGKDLVIAKEYLTKGMRSAASEIVTERLGPRRDMEIARAHHSEIKKDRLTGIDRRLTEQMREGAVHFGETRTAYDRFERSLALQRLSHLQGLGLAAKNNAGVWRLESGWQDTLKTLGKRGDVIRTLSAMEGEIRYVVMFDADGRDQKPVLGRVLTSQAEDELRDIRALIIEGADGKTWHVPIGPQPPGTLPPNGAIVEAAPMKAQARASDRTIANIAAINGGLYSKARHHADDPTASKDYVQAHVRRLEALRRAGFAQRFANGDWMIPDDYLTKAATFEAIRSKGATLSVKSWVGVDEQVKNIGPTWLDDVPEGVLSNKGFGRDATKARDERQKHLMATGVIEHGAVLSDAQKTAMAGRALDTAAASLATSRGETYAATEIGERFEGVYERAVDLPHGRFAVIAKSKEFTLVPWRPELEKARGAALVVKRTGKGIQWTPGKSRGMGL